MKGIVFTEFLDLVSDKFSPEIAENIIDNSELESGGAYTALGTYSHEEMVALVVSLSEETGIDVPTLVKTYGNYLFERFTVLYPKYFENIDNSFDFLEQVDGYIHVEVKKLYPDAQLPRFYTKRAGDNIILLDYYSIRHFEDLAFGMIEACGRHFNEKLAIEMTPKEEDGKAFVQFQLTRG